MSSPPERHPMAVAMEWVARIAGVGLEMVLPGLGGQWLDGKAGTTPFLTLAGFAAGIALGIWHLIVMTSAAAKKK